MKKLKLNKEIITNLDSVKGGVQNIYQVNKANQAVLWSLKGTCTKGCTDGCGPLRSMWNCSKADCTNDCPKPSITICADRPD